MRYFYFLLLPLLFLVGCEEKEEDHSVLDEMVLLEKEEEDMPLVVDSGGPDPQERPFQEEERQR